MRKKKEPKMLTVREAAERIGASESSVRVWVWKGRFPGARLEKPPAGMSYWLIPESALDGFALGKPGPKPKPKTEKGKKR
jgi:excisionase family DNA binding protein